MFLGSDCTIKPKQKQTYSCTTVQFVSIKQVEQKNILIC